MRSFVLVLLSLLPPFRGDIAGSEPHYTWFYRASDQVDRGVKANKVAKANKVLQAEEGVRCWKAGTKANRFQVCVGTAGISDAWFNAGAVSADVPSCKIA